MCVLCCAGMWHKGVAALNWPTRMALSVIFGYHAPLLLRARYAVSGTRVGSASALWTAQCAVQC
eukprot:2644856-Rhodomonas_salina.2